MDTESHIASKGIHCLAITLLMLYHSSIKSVDASANVTRILNKNIYASHYGKYSRQIGNQGCNALVSSPQRMAPTGTTHSVSFVPASKIKPFFRSHPDYYWQQKYHELFREYQLLKQTTANDAPNPEIVFPPSFNQLQAMNNKYEITTPTNSDAHPTQCDEIVIDDIMNEIVSSNNIQENMARNVKIKNVFKVLQQLTIIFNLIKKIIAIV